MFDAGTKYLSAFFSYSASPDTASATSKPHSPLSTGDVSTTRSARSAKRADAVAAATGGRFSVVLEAMLALCCANRCAPNPLLHASKHSESALGKIRSRILPIIPLLAKSPDCKYIRKSAGAPLANGPG